MTGQNTQKQILAMVLLMFLGVAGLGAYIWFDDGRRAEAQDQLLIEDAQRGAEIFAKNCRICHGNDGTGRVGDPSLIGAPLNDPANTIAFRSANSGALQELQTRLHFTISCGRNGTPMPPWAISQGGSLNDFKIDTLVTLITTNAGDAWAFALEEARHEDEVAIEGLRVGLESAMAEGAPQETISGLQDSLSSAEDRFGRGLPIATPTPSATESSCGQRS